AQLVDQVPQRFRPTRVGHGDAITAGNGGSGNLAPHFARSNNSDGLHMPITPLSLEPPRQGEPIAHAPNAPSIVCIAPVTKPASGPANQATIPATSSGRPWRLIAIKLCISSFIGPSAGFASVSMGPGWTTLIVIPRGPKSRARPRASP